MKRRLLRMTVSAFRSIVNGSVMLADWMDAVGRTMLCWLNKQERKLKGATI